MRLAILLAAAGEWARALAVPLALLAVGAGLLYLSWHGGIDQLWPVLIAGALAAGIAIGWIALVVATHTRRQSAQRRRTDGEGEPL
ncbi:hypothetical protein [Glycomyces sp. MUSA5-2]|uniref:hypothetical protein n=1 Tax=Glycomyces sp. MUSA5-2 TaxID=2053002 RepID=UPI0030082CDB